MSDKTVLTQADFDVLEAELTELNARNEGIIAQMSEMDSRELAASSEDAIFQLKREQGDILQRIDYIKDRLSQAELTQGADDFTQIDVGNRVVLYNPDTDEQFTIDIVGTAELEVDGNRVTAASPIGSALIGHQVNDDVTIEIPEGQVSYTIMRILPIPTE